ncbi:MAG TPA: hypothetical protein VHX60_13000 [Acidobacteriaceae bacterium]|jgi:hypothetical protein|nr:hypothetical protein [Acidobacteriaceae bacterium]
MNVVQPVEATRHEYRLRGERVYPIVAAVVIGVLVPIFYVVGGLSSALSVGTAGLIVAGLLMLHLQRSTLVIEGSQLKVRSMFQERTVDLSQIAGRRTYRSRYGNYQVICLKSGRNGIRFSQYSVDDAFRGWLSQIPDLDEKEREAVLAQIAQDQELGATPEERLGVLARAKQVNIGLCIVAGGAAAGYLWGAEAWRPWCFAALAIAPVVTLYLVYSSPLLYALNSRRVDPRAPLNILLLIAGFGLFFRAMNLNFVAASALFRDGLITTVVFLFAFYRPMRRSGQTAAAVFSLLIVSFFYGWGITVGADTISDPAPAQTYHVYVTGKRISRGSRSATYYLRLAPWGPFGEYANSMQVSSKLYKATREGEPICILLHPGLLHAAWFEPVACPGAGP